VKAMLRFPAVIRKLSDDLDWTTDLGDAIVNQTQDVANVIQMLRSKAQQAGTLKTTNEQVVTTCNDTDWCDRGSLGSDRRSRFRDRDVQIVLRDAGEIAVVLLDSHLSAHLPPGGSSSRIEPEPRLRAARAALRCRNGPLFLVATARNETATTVLSVIAGAGYGDGRKAAMIATKCQAPITALR
jgi:Protein of unknown function (DUF3300)